MNSLLNEISPLITQASVAQPKAGGKLKSIEQLPGDASTRKYFRASAEGKTFIVMKMEDYAKEGDRLPFIQVQRHLARSLVDVPKILDTRADEGLMLLEDLGDVTLLRHLQGVSSAEVERHLYERVIDGLVNLQYHAAPGRRKGEAPLDCFALSFDFEKLNWEIGFTIEHFYETHLKRVIRPSDRKIINDGFAEICHKLAAVPTVFTHRDFHSRNIMVTPEASQPHDPLRMVMIDFQDARMGPPQYDLASLLRDSYYQLEEAQVNRLIDYYIARWEAVSGDRLDQDAFREAFDLMTIQRNFKAIGSFASFLNRRGNATYLKYIGNTFENIRRTLLRHPKYSALREVLFHYYYF